jgi:hypothetical protein
MTMNNILSIIGTSTGIVGALLIALNMNMFVLGYALFLLSALSWIIYAVRTSQRGLIMLNSTFAVINAIGLYNFS